MESFGNWHEHSPLGPQELSFLHNCSKMPLNPKTFDTNFPAGRQGRGRNGHYAQLAAPSQIILHLWVFLGWVKKGYCWLWTHLISIKDYHNTLRSAYFALPIFSQIPRVDATWGKAQPKFHCGQRWYGQKGKTAAKRLIYPKVRLGQVLGG